MYVYNVRTLITYYFLTFALQILFLKTTEGSCHVHTQGNQVPRGKASAGLKVWDAAIRGPEDSGDTPPNRETQAAGPGQWADPSHIQVEADRLTG